MQALTLVKPEIREKSFDVIINDMMEMPIQVETKDKAYILNAQIFGKNSLISVLVSPFGSQIRDIMISDYQSIQGKGFFGLFHLDTLENSADIYDNALADEIKELKVQWNLKIKNSISILGVVEKIQN